MNKNPERRLPRPAFRSGTAFRTRFTFGSWTTFCGSRPWSTARFWLGPWSKKIRYLDLKLTPTKIILDIFFFNCLKTVLALPAVDVNHSHSLSNAVILDYLSTKYETNNFWHIAMWQKPQKRSILGMSSMWQKLFV